MIDSDAHRGREMPARRASVGRCARGRRALILIVPGLTACAVCAAATPASPTAAAPAPALVPLPAATAPASAATLATGSVPSATVPPAQPAGASAVDTDQEVSVVAPEPRYVAPTLRDRIGRIWAPVLIDGRGPFRLVLDTGAN